MSYDSWKTRSDRDEFPEPDARPLCSCGMPVNEDDPMCPHCGEDLRDGDPMTADLTRWATTISRCAHMTCEPAATELRKTAEEMRKMALEMQTGAKQRLGQRHQQVEQR